MITESLCWPDSGTVEVKRRIVTPGMRAHPLEHALAHRAHGPPVVLVPRRRETRLPVTHMIGVEPRMNREDAMETREQQTSTDQQHQCKAT